MRMDEDYFDFCIRRAEFWGKFNLLDKVFRLQGGGMSLENALVFVVEELKEELSILSEQQGRYE